MHTLKVFWHMFEFDSQNNLEIFNIYQSQYSCRVHLYKKHVEGKIYGNRNKIHKCISKGREPKFIKISKGGNLQIYKNFKRGGTWKKLGWGKPKGAKGLSERNVGTHLFNHNLGIEKDKNGDFYKQNSINFFKNLPAAANNTALWA